MRASTRASTSRWARTAASTTSASSATSYGPGSIHRISYSSGNQPPVAHLTASPQWGASPLTAPSSTRAGSSDPTAKRSAIEWDLEGDGSFEIADRDRDQEP